MGALSFDRNLTRAARLVRAGNYDDALGIYRSMWETRRVKAAGFNAAVVLGARGDYDEALDILRLLREDYPDDWDILTLMGRLGRYARSS